MTNENEFEDEGGNEGGGAEATKFVEVDGSKFVDDGSGKPKLGDDGKPVPYTEPKPAETPEAKKARLERMQEQHRAKHPELYKDPEGDKSGKKGKKSDEFGLAEKSFLIANGVKGKDEEALVKRIMDSTGNSLETVLESKYFQAELKEIRDAKAAADATPSGSKRSGQSASDTVDYWLSKGELPPNTPENQKLRQDVVNARVNREKSKNMFSDNPVAGNYSKRS